MLARLEWCEKYVHMYVSMNIYVRTYVGQG